MTTRAVWKYPLTAGTTVLLLPRDTTVLSVAVQRQGEVVLYALVHPTTSGTIPRTFVALSTGDPAPIEGTLQFLGTVTPEPGLWFHIFEMID